MLETTSFDSIFKRIGIFALYGFNEVFTVISLLLQAEKSRVASANAPNSIFLSINFLLSKN